MFELLKARLREGTRTTPLPRVGELALPARFRGRPRLQPALCQEGCRACADACPTGAVRAAPLQLDLGACLFCPACVEACPTGAVSFTSDHSLAARAREDLLLEGEQAARLAGALGDELRRVLGRALRLRQVSAGGCSGCEAELNALGNVVFDAAHYGIQFVASPRHADGVVITGPVTTNMERALRETWEAIPAPRIAVAVGACAISGGAFAEAPERRGIPAEIPVDLFVPGCPPHPLTLLDGLLRLLGRRAER